MKDLAEMRYEEILALDVIAAANELRRAGLERIAMRLDEVAQFLTAEPVPTPQYVHPAWIPVSERKPEEGVDVLCYWGSHTPCEVGTYSGERVHAMGVWSIWQASNGDMHEFDADPTHWMPLPDLPSDISGQSK